MRERNQLRLLEHEDSTEAVQLFKCDSALAVQVELEPAKADVVVELDVFMIAVAGVPAVVPAVGGGAALSLLSLTDWR